MAKRQQKKGRFLVEAPLLVASPGERHDLFDKRRLWDEAFMVCILQRLDAALSDRRVAVRKAVTARKGVPVEPDRDLL